MSDEKDASSSLPAAVAEPVHKVTPTSAAVEDQDIEPATALEEDRRKKRGRDAAYGPSTPKGEGDEGKALGGLTPLAKKGRVQPGDVASTEGREITSDTESVPADDDENATTAQPKTPPPPGLEPSSAPGTPVIAGRALPITKREGKETRNLRRRVEALEWEDEGGAPPGESQEEMDFAEGATAAAATATEDEEKKDVEISDVAAEVGESAKLVDAQEGEDVDIANVAAEVSETAEPLHAGDVKDVEIADVAADVAVTAAKVDDVQDKAMPDSKVADKEAAEVAAQVGDSAAKVDAVDESIAASATASTEVADSAVLIDKEQAKDEEIAEVAAEVAESAETVDSKATAAASPAPPAAAATNSFTAFSSKASPFSSFSTSASPFAAVPATAPPAEEQKSKARSAFPSIPPLAAPSTPSAVSRSSAAAASVVPSGGSTPSTPAAGVKPPPPTPATPVARIPPTSTTGAPSPFGAFASSSGFAGASKASTSSGFGSYSATTASPFTKVQASAAEASSSRKLGEPEEEDLAKKNFKEQEVVTGEEDDETIHSVRAKLFAMSNGSWVERGSGPLKLNVTRESGRTGGRLVMRADATHRLLLNAVLFSKFSIEVFQEKYVRFAVIEGTGPVSYMLRMSGIPAAQALVAAVEEQIALL